MLREEHSLLGAARRLWRRPLQVKFRSCFGQAYVFETLYGHTSAARHQ